MKKLFLLAFPFFFTLFASAQSSSLQQDPNVISKKKVLIIPYDPMMHLSDADHEIAEYSEKNPDQLRAMFRIGISQNINKQLASVYESHEMLADMRPQVLKDLDMIYGSISYSFDTVFPIAHPVLDSVSIAHKVSLTQQAKKELDKRKKTGDVKYMNVKLSHKEILTMLAEKYDVDYFIFLNQLEIKTIRNDCVEMSTGANMRAIKIHYSILNKNGEHLFGDVASVSTVSNEIGTIMANSFPPLGKDISTNVKF